MKAWAVVRIEAPLPIVARLNEAITKALRQSDMIAFVDKIGSDLFPTSPPELAAFVLDDARRWVEIVETALIERK